MTKGDILDIYQAFNNIEANISQELLKPFKFLFAKNRFLFKSVFDENTEIVKTLVKGEDIKNSELNNFLEKISDYQDFKKEEVDINFYTIKIELLENTDFDSSVAGYLIQNGFIV